VGKATMPLAPDCGVGMAELGNVPGCGARGPIRQLKLAARPATVPQARSILRQLLCEWDLEQLSDTAMLLMSELVTNAVKASVDGVRRRRLRRNNIMASIRLNDSGLVLEVWDANPAPPVMREVDLTSEGGRGLLMIECLGDKWGHHPADGGKVVWCEIAFPQLALPVSHQIMPLPL
jgi:anti-sigma regulatory factor (Ser/Thr protein kinase)